MVLVIFLVGVGAQSYNASVPASVSGPWYYLADGLERSFPYATIPGWMNNAGNFISLAFMNPSDLPTVSDPVPSAFKSTASYFNNLKKNVFFSIGGYAYAGNWNWLNNVDQAQRAGTVAASIAKQYSVGIEIDYEGGADPLNGLANFITAFRAACPMGQAGCLLSMDLYGSPGGAAWQSNVVKKFLPPSGTPGQAYGNGVYLDFVNVMVIDGQPVSIAETFWQQWFDTGILTTTRSTFSLVAGFSDTFGICYGDSNAKASIDEAVSFLSPHHIFGIVSWAVCPPAPGSTESCADWDPSCNADAPGFSYLCSKLGSC